MKKLLEQVIIFDDDAIKTYDTYNLVRSPELFYVVAKFLCKETKSQKVDFEEVNYLIRYDKKLKDLLYVFLSTIEEYFKNLVMRHFSFNGKEFIQTTKKEDVVNLDCAAALNNWYATMQRINHRHTPNMFAYFCHDRYQIPHFDQQTLMSLNNIRNRVMHLSYLLFPVYTTETFHEHRAKLMHDIDKIKETLPDPWKKTFIQKINDLKTHYPIAHHKFLLEEI